MTKMTPEKEIKFCSNLAETGIVARACKSVGISRETAYKHKKNNPAFAKLWTEALEIGVTALEDEAHRRAFEGSDKPLVHQGQFTYIYARDEHGRIIQDVIEVEVNGQMAQVMQARIMRDPEGNPLVETVKEYSDTLAIFLLKAHNPEKYRDNMKVQHTGVNDGPIQLEHKATALAEILAKAKLRKDGDISDLV